MSSKPPAESPASPWKAAEKKQADEKAAAEEYARDRETRLETHALAVPKMGTEALVLKLAQEQWAGASPMDEMSARYPSDER